MPRTVKNPLSPTGIEIEVDDDITDEQLARLLNADADEVETANDGADGEEVDDL